MKYLKRHKNYLIGFYAFLLFIHFILKDLLYPISIIYYAFPILILLIINFLLVFIDRKNIILKFSFLFLLILFFIKDYKLGSNQLIENQNIKVLYWNIAKKKENAIPILIKKITSEKPDIIALVEAKDFSVIDVKNLKTLFPNYQFKIMKGSMVVGLNSKSITTNYTELSNNSKFNLIKTSLNKEDLKIMLVDVTANPFKSREHAIDTIYKTSTKNNCSLILGDFNTPYNSTHFNKYKNIYSNADRESGSGFISSWAFGIPLMQIDHIWSAKNLIVLDCQKEYYSQFDHPIFIISYN